MRISWLDISERINHELQQREEEGDSIAELRREWEEIGKLTLNEEALKEKAESFYSKLEETPSVVLNNNNEPSDWKRIEQMCNITQGSLPSFNTNFIEDRILGGWLGRSAGCLLGKPIEKLDRNGFIELLSSNGTWPISDYISGKGIPDHLLKKYPWNKHSGKESLKENIECMTEDDDMNYPMLNLAAFEDHGESFTTENLIQTWMKLAPVLSTFTAERVAYVNALNGLTPPETAQVRNPYREWIGAQIRADVWGWISPAQPARAAQCAWRDARLSHVRNGMYSEMFFAAAIAASFRYDTAKSVIEEALQYVPGQSRFAEAIRSVLSIPIHKQSWDTTVETLYLQFGKYHWVHSINNAALVVAALLSANGNYETAICNVVMGGWDTDSNGATTGSIMGTMLGAKNLPSKWIVPLKNKIRSSLKGFDNSLLSDLALRTVKVSHYSH